MRRAFAVLSYLIIICAGFRFSQSTSGFFLLGLGPALLLDRYFFCRLPWPTAVVWSREALVRGAYFVAGSLGAFVVRLGLVPVSEALFAGLALSMGGFLFESLFDALLSSMAPASGRMVRAYSNAWVRDGCSGLLFLAFLAIAAPLEALHPLRTVPKRTPAVVGLAFEEVRFTAADGVDLAGWLMPHPQARGNVIFCHGHGRNREQGTGLLPTLHELGVNVLAFDFRGHGGSGGHTATFGKHEVQDLVAAEAFLSRRFPGKPVFLIGVSYGAAVALQALPQLPTVRAVWCESAFGRLMPVVENQFAGLPRGVRQPLVSAYQVMAWLDCGFWGADINPIDHLEQVRVPIHFCHGLDDKLVPFSEGKRLYDCYDGPKACYWVEAANHYDLRRRNKNEYLKRLGRFLAENLPMPPRNRSDVE